MRHTASLLAVLIIACLAALPALGESYQGSFQRTYQVTGPVDLEVLTRSGDITVHSGPAGTVSISGKIHVGDRWLSGDRSSDVSELEKNPPIRQSGNSIHVDYPTFHNISIDFDVTTPADTALRFHTGSGDARIEALHGNLDLESGSGDMKLDDITGDVHARTGSGDVQARDVAGAFTATAGSGDIRLDAKGQGNVRVETGSGNIELRGVNGSLNVRAGSGDVRADGTQTGDWDMRTGSGNIEVRLPQDAAFDLDASTSSGRLDIGRPVTMTIQGDLGRAHRAINGRVRGGGPQVRIHTGSGDIHID